MHLGAELNFRILQQIQRGFSYTTQVSYTNQLTYNSRGVNMYCRFISCSLPSCRTACLCPLAAFAGLSHAAHSIAELQIHLLQLMPLQRCSVWLPSCPLVPSYRSHYLARVSRGEQQREHQNTAASE
jgi:hypothetical protein